MITDLIARQVSFSIETTLAGRTHLRTLKAARAKGYKIVLLYFSPIDADICLKRIAWRVSDGGHDVPETDVRRRFDRSIRNINDYAALCDVWCVFKVLSGAVAADGRAVSITDCYFPNRIAPDLRDWLAGLPTCEEQA